MPRYPFAALLASAAAAVSAQPVPGGPTGLLIDQGRITSTRMPPTPMAPPGTALADHVTTVDAKAGHDVPIRGIQFDGVQVPERVGQAGTPFLGRPASAETLTSLANALSDAYGQSAIALYTVAIPAQRFAGGILHVRIAEGFIEQVIITGDVAHSSVRLVRDYATMLAAERPLRKASLQRYLSLVRDIPGLSVDVKLLKGARPGGVKLVLILAQKAHDVSFSFDNQSQEQLTRGEFQATGKLYGALRPGDETDLVVSTAANFKSYVYKGLSHSTPVGANGARASVSIAHLSTRTRGTHIKGDATVASVGASHPLIRSYQRNLTLSASLDGVNSDNALLGSLLSRERTRALRGSASFSDVANRHGLSASVTISRGLDILGADTDATLADPTFAKVNGRIGINRLLGKHFVMRLNGAGQWSDNALPAVERFIVGGADFGRAYPVAILAGDRGAAGSAEFAWRPTLPAKFSNSELYLFGDTADVRYLPLGASPGASYDLSSAGAGVRLAYREKAQLALEAAKRLDRPFPGYDKGWQLNVAWKLSLGR